MITLLGILLFGGPSDVRQVAFQCDAFGHCEGKVWGKPVPQEACLEALMYTHEDRRYHVVLGCSPNAREVVFEYELTKLSTEYEP
jgi:hypothetical protein